MRAITAFPPARRATLDLHVIAGGARFVSYPQRVITRHVIATTMQRECADRDVMPELRCGPL
jgi:hypothetical protein